MMFVQLQMTNSLNILNNVAVEYFSLGLQELSYQIWDELYHVIQEQPEYRKELLPVISCNMGNVLRQNGLLEEAGRVCLQGLKCCFETGEAYAVPELLLQLSTLCMKSGKTELAKWLHLSGSHFLSCSRQERNKTGSPAPEHLTSGQKRALHHGRTLEELMEQDFLLYCRESGR